MLLHGNGVTAHDWKTSGVIDALGGSHRVIAFDRPGFGYSTRPRRHVWTAAAQAALLHEALHTLAVDPAVIVAHSWGTLVALALALEYPAHCRRLLLYFGILFPDVSRRRCSLWRSCSAYFGRRSALHDLAAAWAFARTRAVRAALRAGGRRPGLRGGVADGDPSVAIRANAEDTALMVSSATRMEGRYKDLTVPVAIVAGPDDKVVSPAQSERLADEIPASELLVIGGVGHMLHYAAKEKITETIAVMANAQPDLEHNRARA